MPWWGACRGPYQAHGIVAAIRIPDYSLRSGAQRTELSDNSQTGKSEYAGTLRASRLRSLGADLQVLLRPEVLWSSVKRERGCCQPSPFGDFRGSPPFGDFRGSPGGMMRLRGTPDGAPKGDSGLWSLSWADTRNLKCGVGKNAHGSAGNVVGRLSAASARSPFA